jgi:hypothetical protein
MVVAGKRDMFVFDWLICHHVNSFSNRGVAADTGSKSSPKEVYMVLNPRTHSWND